MTAMTRAPYEAMFLISQGEAADLAGAVDHIVEIITRHSGELIAMKKWDERRLAYEIDKQRRGVYLLTYFYADGNEITAMERDLNLSERVMRHMFLRADHLTEDQMRAADAREELAAEAKLRAEKAAERDAEAGGVRLGRGGEDDDGGEGGNEPPDVDTDAGDDSSNDEN